MAVVTRWDPFRDLMSMPDELNEAVQRVLASERSAASGQRESQRERSRRPWAPALDIRERKEAYVVSVELAGVGPEGVDVTLEDGLLTVQGERRLASEADEEHFHRMERRYGPFRRSITLPTQVAAERIQATFADGVLEVVVPKAEEAKPRRIPVRTGQVPTVGTSSEASTGAGQGEAVVTTS